MSGRAAIIERIAKGADMEAPKDKVSSRLSVQLLSLSLHLCTSLDRLLYNTVAVSKNNSC
jgi:hypothetical protein